MAPIGTRRLSAVKKLLVVGSSPSFLERIKSLLSKDNLIIFTAISSDEALEVHRDERVNLIISMLDMPVMGGDTLCSIIRQTDELRNVSFILVCNNDPEELDRASRCGANACVTRPLNPEVLLDTAARLLSVPPRKDYRAVLKGEVHGRKEGLYFTGITHNVCVSGIMFESDKELNEKDVITNIFVVSGSLKIVAEGKVVRSVRRGDGKFTYGVQFSNIDSEYQKAIEKYVANGN